MRDVSPHILDAAATPPDLADQPLRAFLDGLASTAPAPGGGAVPAPRAARLSATWASTSATANWAETSTSTPYPKSLAPSARPGGVGPLTAMLMANVVAASNGRSP